MNRKTIILGVTGSIAAYKAADLVRRLQDAGYAVAVIMTRAATEFITPLTFRTLTRQAVGVDLFDPDLDWKPEHLALADRADCLVIAPCTANVLAKMAHGLADDLLSCTALSVQCPVLVVPAMNERMWDHAATQANVKILRSRGVTILDVGTGGLACGVTGRGRMADPPVIVKAVQRVLNARNRKRS
ncbi:MAG: phosphopantothenoylcysteine decarboxylase [Lentisphaerae bacterium RIFOXYC12_FULL_60_16]|nr:MAG: phosphopantothenoylcysteine decarboxylase [Lentisphaerae bacterium RIFOXYC12_FULL_60_16]